MFGQVAISYPYSLYYAIVCKPKSLKPGNISAYLKAILLDNPSSFKREKKISITSFFQPMTGWRHDFAG